MDRQARTRDTVLVKSIVDCREMAGTTVLAGGRGKDDREQNILVPLLSYYANVRAYPTAKKMAILLYVLES